jgi:YggT family protein
MNELLGFLSQIIWLFEIIVIAAVVLQMLLQNNLIPFNPFVRSLSQGLTAVTEPFLAPIRRRLPHMNGIDLSPLILVVGCWFARAVIIPNLLKAF